MQTQANVRRLALLVRGAAFSCEELATWRDGVQWRPVRHCAARSAVAAPLRHCEARSAVAIQVPVPRPQWIASFLAMTGRGRNDGAGVGMTRRRRSDRPLRHCEARSAVAIHVPVPRPQWIASFLAMTGQGGNNGPFLRREAAVCSVVTRPSSAPSLRGAQRRGNPSADAEMDCFVPCNDGVGAQRRRWRRATAVGSGVGLGRCRA